MDRVSSPTPGARPPSLLVGIREAAHLLGISESLVYEMVQTGELRTVPTSRRRKLIPRSEIERFASLEPVELGQVLDDVVEDVQVHLKDQL